MKRRHLLVAATAFLGNRTMCPTDAGAKPLRLAVLTESISHYEIPLFRLCAQIDAVCFKVFYIQPIKTQRYDHQYDQVIDWGYDLLAGYDSAKVNDAEALDHAAQEWGADVVLIYGYGWSGAPWIILRNWLRGQAQVHRGTLNYYHDPRRPLKGRLMRPLGRILLRLFDAHHYGGDYSRKVLLDAGAKESALFFVPYSVDTPHFLAAAEHQDQQNAALAIRKVQGWEADDHVILFIAQHNWFKGPDIAMEVFRQVVQVDSKARFLVVGSGSMTDAMKASAQQHLDAKAIHFTGFVSSAQTVPYYLASDLVICTSRYETWGRMVNEAMLCRRPCLVSRIVPVVGGLVVDGENGYVVDAPEANQFVPVIHRYFALPMSERQIMGEAAREKAQTFAYEPHIDNILAAARYALAQTRCGKAKVLPE